MFEVNFDINTYTSLFFDVALFTEKSERIGETSYFLPWYDFPVDVAKNINTIMLRTSLPSCLSGANILELSLQAFCDVSPHAHHFK